MAGKTSMTFKGVDLDYSNNEFVATPFHHHLFDEGISISPNVTFTSPCRSAYSYKIGAPAGKLLDLTYIYANKFSSDSVIDGAIEGQVIADLFFYASVSSASYIYLSGVYVHLFRRNADGSETDIIPRMNILNAAVTRYGNSTLKHDLIPCFYSYDVSGHIIPRSSLLCLTVELWGYHSSAASMYPMMRADPSEGDLRITLPMVEDE